jgi:hypothetical protein
MITTILFCYNQPDQHKEVESFNAIFTLNKSATDVIHYKEMNVNSLSLGASKKQLILKFGNKYQEETVESNVYETDVARIKYGKNYFDFVKDKFIDFSIEEPPFSFMNIKLNSSMGSIKEKFPNTKPYKSGSRYLMKVRIDKTDAYVIFEFENNKLVKIYTWNDL